MFYMIMMLEEDHSDKPYDCVKERPPARVHDNVHDDMIM